MPIACPVPRDTPHREVPDLLARHSTGRYRVVEHSSVADRPRARQEHDRGAERRRPGRRREHLGHAARPTPTRCRRRSARARADLSLDDLPVGDDVAGARGAVVGARAPARRSGALAALGRARAARALARARPRRARALGRRRRRAGALAPARPAGAGRRPGRPRRRPARCCARAGRRGDAAAHAVGRARDAGAAGARDREPARGDRGEGRPARRGRGGAAGRGARVDRMAARRPTAIPPRSSCRSRTRSRRPPSARSRSASGARRGSPAMRGARPSGGSTSAWAEAVSVRFRCCVQTFPRRSRPCWLEEAPIRCSTSISPCSPPDHDRTPPPAPPPAALRDGTAVDLHGRGRRGQRGRARGARRASRALRRLHRVARAGRGRRPARAHDAAEPRAGGPAAGAARRAARAGACGFAVRAGGLVAAASAAAVLGIAAAGWNSSPPVPTQSGVVRPSEIVVGWNTSDSARRPAAPGRAGPAARARPPDFVTPPAMPRRAARCGMPAGTDRRGPVTPPVQFVRPERADEGALRAR